LPDDITRVQRNVQVGIIQRGGGVRGEHGSDVYRLIVERARLRGVDVERAERVAVGIELGD
jgi:hypothetical protein